MRRLSRLAVLGAVSVGLSFFVACGEGSSESPTGQSEGGTDSGRLSDANRSDSTSSVDDAAGGDGATEDSGGDDVADASPEASDLDANVDAGMDATVDAGPTTPLYFVGDFSTNNTSSLGLAHVPMGAATPSTTVIAAKARTFATTPDGSKVVFAADITTTGRFDLYVADADGSNATLRVAMPGNASVTDIEISPDGGRIAYIADAELEGQADAFVVELSGTTLPSRVSPARAVGNIALDAQTISWSRNSAFVAIVGDFTVDKKNELWIADVTATPIVPVAALGESSIPAPVAATVGVSAGLHPIWTSGNKVCVKADLSVTPPSFRLYCANSDASNFATPINFPATPIQLGSYGISPDGMTLAFSADSVAAPDAYEIFAMPANDSAAPTRLTSGTISAVAGASRGPNFSVPLKYSPDGFKIGFIADILVDNRYELYVVPAAGAEVEKRLTVVGTVSDPEQDVTAFAWSPDSHAIAFIADHRANNDFELFRVLDATTADQVPQLVRGVVSSGDIADLTWNP